MFCQNFSLSNHRITNNEIILLYSSLIPDIVFLKNHDIEKLYSNVCINAF